MDIDNVNVETQGGVNRSQANLISDKDQIEGTTPVVSNIDVMASSAGDTDEYTKMLIRQELDTRMVDIEEKMETMVQNQNNIDMNKSVLNDSGVVGIDPEFEKNVNN